MTINSRDKRDVYYFMAKQNNYRARSIFKLKQIDEKYNVFNDTDINVLDLCAAPGSWSQYLSELKANRKNINNIIAVDLQDMMPIEGVTIYKDDITNEQFIKKLSNMQINRVICDGAPDVTGFYELDLYAQIDLLKASLKITLHVCNDYNNVIFISKLFRGKYTKYIIHYFKQYFQEVILTKPRASRSTSNEAFIVCKKLYNTTGNIDIIDFSVNLDNITCEMCGYGEPDPDYYVEEIIKNDNYKNSKPIDVPYEDAINMRRLNK